MKITIGNEFKEIVKGISSIADEIIISLLDEGMMIIAMDISQVQMVSCIIPKEKITEYIIEEPRKLGINLELLKKVVKNLSGDIVIEEKDNQLIIKSGKTKSVIKLLDIEDKGLSYPSLTFTGSINCDKELVNSLKELTEEADGRLEFEKNNEGTFIKTKTDLMSSEIDITDKATGENFSSMYSNKFISRMIKVGEITKLNLASKYPIEAEYKFSLATVKSLLAPRVESDEEEKPKTIEEKNGGEKE